MTIERSIDTSTRRLSYEDYTADVEAAIASEPDLTAAAFEALMAALLCRAQDAMPPLAFHAWAATSFGLRRGLITDEDVAAMGADLYGVLFELASRGILDEMDRAISAGERLI